jgi:hypothetical protein
MNCKYGGPSSFSEELRPSCANPVLLHDNKSLPEFITLNECIIRYDALRDMIKLKLKELLVLEEEAEKLCKLIKEIGGRGLTAP